MNGAAAETAVLGLTLVALALIGLVLVLLLGMAALRKSAETTRAEAKAEATPFASAAGNAALVPPARPMRAVLPSPDVAPKPVVQTSYRDLAGAL